jgi:hypothetical protein
MASKTKPLSREEFLAQMAIEADRLERIAREIREGKWGKFDIDERATRVSELEERVTICITGERMQAHGTGL